MSETKVIKIDPAGKYLIMVEVEINDVAVMTKFRSDLEDASERLQEWWNNDRERIYILAIMGDQEVRLEKVGEIAEE